MPLVMAIVQVPLLRTPAAANLVVGSKFYALPTPKPANALS